ncbi:Uncharacterised protein [Candidatus Anstonella stagnisolia]|nr:Uncharacterised protein [Candidatus Anstonella stagnisolia]
MLLVQHCSSDAQNIATLLQKIAVFEKQGKLTIQVLNPDIAYSPLCINAAFETSEGKNSLLTTLALTQNFSSALKIAGAKDAQDFVLVAWGKGVKGSKGGKSAPKWEKISGALGLKKLSWGKKDAAHFAHFYGISKEALKFYPLEKLIVEKMALSKL